MKRIFCAAATLALSSLLLSSCMKEEKPYPVPGVPEQTGDYPVQNSQVSIGADYATQVYFSFTKGQIASNRYDIWDISFTTASDNNELWMNGGNRVLVYPTGNADYAAVTNTSNTSAAGWKYDNPSGLSGQSGLGILSNQNHIGEVLIVMVEKVPGTKIYYKLQITEDAADHYTIKAGDLASAAGTSYTLPKDQDYNFVFFSFTSGMVQVEPPKTEWDIVFTRYRHIYYKYNPDGSDFPYPVNGVLANPYKTKSAQDSTRQYDFYDFTLDDAQTYKLVQDRDEIGFGWKTVNINTEQYTVQPRRIYLVQDQNDQLWKIHFVSFYNDNGTKGYPRFEYQRLR